MSSFNREPQIQAGDRTALITWERNDASTKNDYGEDIDSWVTHCRVYTHLRPQRAGINAGRELPSANQMHADAGWIANVEYSSQTCDMHVGMRGVWGSRTFHIVEPPRNIDNRNIQLEFTVIEVE
jgi:head-tail adaptor